MARRLAFVVGCGHFQDSEVVPLLNSSRDATEIFKRLTDPALGAAEPLGSILLVDPAYSDLLTELEEFLSSLKAEDQFILYFSGHAQTLPASGWAFFTTDTEKRAPALRSFSFRQLQGLMSETSRNKAILIFDTCYARTADEFDKHLVAKGGVEGTAPTKLGEGQVLMWSSGIAEQSWETTGHSMFTGCLIEAIDKGADKSAGVEYILPKHAIVYIRKAFPARGFDKYAMPTMRESGDTSSLYLVRNPKFDKSAIPLDPKAGIESFFAGVDAISEGARAFETVLALGDALRAGKKVLEPRKSIRSSPLNEYIFYDPSSGSEVCFVQQDPITVIIGEFAALISWQGLLAVILVSELGDFFHSSTHMSLFRVCVGLFVLRLFVSLGACFRSVPPFLLSTQDGFYRSTLASRKSYAWSEVESIESQTQIPMFSNVTVSGKKDSFPLCIFSIRSSFRHVALDVLQWGKQYSKSRWQLSVYDQMDGKGQDFIALFGVTNYKNLPEIKAPQSDVVAMAALLGQSIQSTKPSMPNDRLLLESLDPDLVSFENKLEFAFSRARNGSLLVYFSGHGLTHNRELYLAVGATNKRRLVTTAFPAYKFLDLVAQYHIANFILVLDCCFASVAADATGLALDQVAPALELLHSRDEVAFTILAASGRNEEALATNKQSVFTRKFIEAASSLVETRGAVVVSDLCDSVAREMSTLGLGQQLGVYASEQGLSTVILSGLPGYRRISERIRMTLDARIANQARVLKSSAEQIVKSWGKDIRLPVDWKLLKLSSKEPSFILIGPLGVASHQATRLQVFPADQILDVREDHERTQAGMAHTGHDTYKISIVDRNLNVTRLFSQTIFVPSEEPIYSNLRRIVEAALSIYECNRKKAERQAVTPLPK